MNSNNYKRLLLCLFLCLGAGLLQQARGQITSINATAYNYSSNYCVTPAGVELSVFGTVTGTLTATDSLTITFFFADGSDTTLKIPAGMGGGAITDSFGTGLMHTYNLAGTYTPMVTVTAASGVSDTAYANSFTFDNSCANVSGHLFIDANGNCNYDAGDSLIYGLYVKAVNTTTGSIYYSTVTGAGSYMLNLPSGYTYTLTAGSWWAGMTPTCPAGGSATLNITGSGSITQDFGFGCGSASPDLSVLAASGGFRPGFIRGLNIYGFSNEFCNNVPATITLTLPPLTSYAASWWGPAPTVSGNTVTWDVSSLSGLNDFMAGIGIYTDPSAVIGDSACISVTIVSTGTADPDMTNNTYNVCIPFNNSFDPNDKNVAPRGLGNNGLIPMNTDMLTYHINFQNTGNDTAYNITIKDQLDPNLDPASVRILSSSHPLTSTIVNGNELQFRFSNIMLPDSNVNEPASHGYVNYTVQVKPSIASGAVISNTAHIYFDFNDAIVTNTTVNTLSAFLSVQHIANGDLKADIYPNPAFDKVMVRVADNKAFTATLVDITGRQALQQKGEGTLQLDTHALPSGVYHLGIRSGTQVLHSKVVIQR